MTSEEQAALVNVERMIRVLTKEVCEAFGIQCTDLVGFTYESIDGDWVWRCRVAPRYDTRNRMIRTAISGFGATLQEAKDDALESLAGWVRFQEEEKRLKKARKDRKKAQRVQSTQGSST